MKLNSVKPKGKETDDGLPSHGGITLHLSHEHLKAMGHDTPLSHGAEVHFEGRGHVSSVSSSDGYKGGEDHHMTLTFHHAGMETEDDGDEGKSDLRDELTRNADKATKDGGKVKMAARRGDDAVTSRTQQAYKDRAGKAESSGAAKTEQTGAKPKVTG